MDILATPTATLSPEQSTGGESFIEAVNATLEVSGCTAGEIEWIFPEEGGEVSEVVELIGTVNIPNLGFYKYEFSQMGSDNWITIAAGNEKKVDEPLGGIWNTSQLVPGDYNLRLIVTDSENQDLPACIISVRVVTP